MYKINWKNIGNSETKLVLYKNEMKQKLNESFIKSE